MSYIIFNQRLWSSAPLVEGIVKAALLELQ